MSEPTILPDGSGFGIMSFPLPKDHWLYKEREYEEGAVDPNDLPAPILTHSLRQQVIAAIRYAVRSATNCGKEDDFDPDALVQNAVYALCGPYGKAAPTPPSIEDHKVAERYRWLRVALSERSAKGRNHHFCSIKEGHNERTAMKDQHEKIKGYRDLSQEEIDLMNEGKALAEQCGAYLEKLMANEGTDKRAVALGKTNLQQGFMWAIRGVAQPTTF